MFETFLQKLVLSICKHTNIFNIYSIHAGPSFNTGTENTIQVSKFKRIGFEKNGGFRANRFVNIIYLLSRSVSLYPNKNTLRAVEFIM